MLKEAYMKESSSLSDLFSIESGAAELVYAAFIILEGSSCDVKN